MLKINLVPSGALRGSGKTASAAGDLRIFAFALVATLVILSAAILVFHSTQTDELGKIRVANSQREAAVRAIRARVSDHARVRRELDDIHARQTAIQRLEANRTGPTAMLIEVSQLLSPGGRPTNADSELERIQRDDPSRMFNPNWDSKTVWLTMFTESEHNVNLEGYGRTADDVAEFMRRLMLSQYFDNVTLERSEGAVEEQTHLQVQRFKLTAHVRY
jgi:type IV pilus assembly protein PilN